MSVILDHRDPFRTSLTEESKRSEGDMESSHPEGCIIKRTETMCAES